MLSIIFKTLNLLILSITPTNTMFSSNCLSGKFGLFMAKIFDVKFGKVGDIYAIRSRAAQLTSLWSWPVAPSGVCG